MYLCIYVSLYPSVYLFVYLSINQSIGAVIGVVDHHEDTNAFPSAPLRIVEPAVRESLACIFRAIVRWEPYRGTSLIRKSAPLVAFSRTIPRTLWWS